jgi:predicted Zn-dependent peptidase
MSQVFKWIRRMRDNLRPTADCPVEPPPSPTLKSPTLIGVQAQKLLWVGVLSLLLVIGALPAPAVAETHASPPANQEYIDRVAENITEFTLDNGMRFIVMERHQAPVISFMTYVNVGGAEEEDGKTGAAHYLEHLAFKGTTRIGTTNIEAELQALDRLDELFAQIKAAEQEGDNVAAAELQAQFEATLEEASSYIIQNEYGQIVEQAGGVGLNATTSADATRYFFALPSNKLELWMSLESERFLEPVFREFFEEKDVILEERRMRTENSPVGRMVEAFLETALPNYPYGRPVIGYAEDLYELTRDDITEFFETYYTPDRMIITLVGDVDTAEVRRMAETYFGRFPARTSPPLLNPTLPPQTEPKEIVLELASEPWHWEGFRRPGITHPDNQVYEAIAFLLADGRTSRLYQALIVQDQLALDIGIANSFPGDRFDNLFLIYAPTAPGRTVDEVAAVMDREIERLKTEPISEQELDRIKTQSRANLIRVLASNDGMARLLPEYEAKTGSWRNLFEELNAIEAITAADIQRVAQDLFRPENLTVGRILPASSEAETSQIRYSAPNSSS